MKIEPLVIDQQLRDRVQKAAEAVYNIAALEHVKHDMGMIRHAIMNTQIMRDDLDAMVATARAFLNRNDRLITNEDDRVRCDVLTKYLDELQKV